MLLTVIGCWGAYPNKGEGTSAYLIQHEGFNLLLECGSACLSLLPEYLPPEKLNGLVLSHYHSDHIADLGCLQYVFRVNTELDIITDPLPVYGPGSGEGFQKLTYCDYTKGIELVPGTPRQLGPLVCHSIFNSHGEPCLAIKIISNAGTPAERTLVYSGDTGWDSGLVSFCRGADVLLCESSLYNKFEGMLSGHLTAGQAGKLAEESGIKTLVLTHFPHYGRIDDLKKEAESVFTGRTMMARSGLKIEI